TTLFSTQDDTTKCFAGSKEVNDSISQKVNSEQDIEDLLTTICTQGLNLVEEKALLSRAAMEQRLEEAVEDIDLTPSLGAPGTDNDPERIYLREMGASSLLTREGEVDLAKRIERGQLSTLKALSRSPIVIHEVWAMGTELKGGRRSIKETMIFNEEEVDDEILQDRVEEVTHRIDQMRKHYKEVRRLTELMANASADKKAREYRRYRCRLGRQIVRMSLIVRNLGLTNSERKRLAGRVSETVEIMRSLDHQIRSLEKRIANARNEELKKTYGTTQRQRRADMRRLENDVGVTLQELQRTQREIIKGEMEAEQAKHELIE